MERRNTTRTNRPPRDLPSATETNPHRRREVYHAAEQVKKLEAIVKHVSFSRSLFEILAVVLFASLLAPAGTAAEGNSGPAQVSAGAKSAGPTNGIGSVPNGANPNGANPGSPELLSEDELAELSQRAEEPGPEVAGGALSNEHLTYIVIAIAAAVIVLIAK